MKNWMYRWLPIIFGCHCKEDRSFYWKNEKFPICARCTGEAIGMIVGLLCCIFFRTTIKFSVIIMLPMILDGTVQMFTKYESNNFKRVITGMLFGYGAVMLFIISNIAAVQFGMSLVK